MINRLPNRISRSAYLLCLGLLLVASLAQTMLQPVFTQGLKPPLAAKSDSKSKSKSKSKSYQISAFRHHDGLIAKGSWDR